MVPALRTVIDLPVGPRCVNALKTRGLGNKAVQNLSGDHFSKSVCSAHLWALHSFFGKIVAIYFTYLTEGARGGGGYWTWHLRLV